MEDQAPYKTTRPNERDVKHGAQFDLRGETVTVQTIWQHGGIWWISYTKPDRYLSRMVGYTKQYLCTDLLQSFMQEIQFPDRILNRATFAPLTR